MHYLSSKISACTLAIVMGLSGSSAAISAPDNKWVMEEITVTARKREEGLSETPLSVSAFTAEELDYRGVTNISEISAFTPNLVFQNNPSFGGASNAAAIYIRGIGQKEFLPTTEPGVGLYLDGVYIARSVGALLDLVDIKRVEVLRGPQGTLFGRNTIGGAISITTKEPHQESDGRLELAYGTDNYTNLRGSANFALTDNLFASVNLAAVQQDGYVERTDGTDLGNDDTVVGRIALRWLATENLEVNFTADATRDRENGPALNLTGINLGNPVDPDTPPFAVLNNIGANIAAGGPPVPCATPDAPLNLAVPGCYDNRYLASNGDNQGTAPAFSDTDIRGTNLTLAWQINEYTSLKSITAYRDLESDFGRDGDHSPLTISEFIDLMDQDQFTQELQLTGSALDSRLQWIAGSYYFAESGNNINLLNFTASRFRSGGKFDNESWAFYTQASYDITENLSLTAGLRYTDETKQFLPDQIIFENKFAGTGTALDAPFLQAGSRILPFLRKEIELTETSPLINLSYNFDIPLMIYGSYSEGFKSGGFSQRVFPPIVAPFTAPAGTPDIDLIPTFDPEFVQVFELGFKWSGFNNRLKINGATFHTKYNDLQIQVFTSVAPVTKNAASAEIDGFELELKALSNSGWFAEFSVGYVDAGYTSIDEATTFVNRSNAFERISDWSVSSALSKDFYLEVDGQITTRIDWSYHSSFFNDTFNTPEISQSDGYEVINANVTWLDASQTWSINLGVNNLLANDYLITGIIGDAFQSYEQMENRGREWRFSVTREF